MIASGDSANWTVKSASDGKRLYTFRKSNIDTPQWAPHGEGLDYVQTIDGVSNIWRRPLAGGAPTQVTHFASGEILGFAWSHDGSWLSAARGEVSNDVILVSNFR